MTVFISETFAKSYCLVVLAHKTGMGWSLSYENSTIIKCSLFTQGKVIIRDSQTSEEL